MPEIDFDPQTLIDQAISSGFDASIFSEVREDVKRAPNIAAWLTDKRYLGLRPYPRQLQIASLFIEDWCPDCSDNDFFLKLPVDADLMEILDRVVFLDYGVCPECQKTRLDFQREGKFFAPTELDVCAGQRGGKSALTALLASYATHCQLCLPSPSEYYELIPNSMLMCTFVALTATQVSETLWQAFKDQVSGSPWFRDYHEMLANESKRLGVQLVKQMDTFLWYEHKRILCNYQGADVRTLRGKTRFFAAIDELGWFNAEAASGRVRVNAEGTYDALDRSLTTVRSKAAKRRGQGHVAAPDAWMCNISSPSEVNDMIMQLVREGRDPLGGGTGDPAKCVFHLPTWEMNPDVTQEFLESQRRKNPHTFDRDYRATPPLANAPFIPNVQPVIDLAVRSKRKSLVRTAVVTQKDAFGQDTLYRKIVSSLVDKQTPRVLTVDAGEKLNAFAITVAHSEGATTVADALIEIAPTETHGVNFPQVFDNLILQLVSNYNVCLVAYDRWQSADQVQRLREQKIEAIRYSLRFTDFVDFRARVLSGNLLLPQPEISNLDLSSVAHRPEQLEEAPVCATLLQLATVREVGRQVTKPARGNDDLFRTLVLADYLLNNEKLQKQYHLRSLGVAGHTPSKIVGFGRILSLNKVQRASDRFTKPQTSVGVTQLSKKRL